MLLSPIQAQVDRVSVVIDTSEAIAVLKAVKTPTFTQDEALQIARLPGSHGNYPQSWHNTCFKR